MLTSSNPSGGSSAWQVSSPIADNLLSHLSSISCPTPRLCVASDDVGNAYTSIDPTAGARAWMRTLIDGDGHLDPESAGVVASCPATGLCVGVDNHGYAVTSTDPAGPAERAAKPRLSHGSLAGIAGGRPRLALTLTAGIPPAREVERISLRAPAGISFAATRHSLAHGIVVRDQQGRRLRSAAGGRGGVLTITLRSAALRIQVAIARPAISVNSTRAREVEAHEVGTLTFLVKTTDAGGRATGLTLQLRLT